MHPTLLECYWVDSRHHKILKHRAMPAPRLKGQNRVEVLYTSAWPAIEIQDTRLTMKSPVVLIGIGEMGGVFARGLLRAGHPVYPVTRHSDINASASDIQAPEMVLVAVAESDLHSTLERLPENWKTQTALLQNELLPADWQQHGLDNPTVISVWFEKKPGRDAKVLLPSPVYGPKAEMLSKSLATINVPTRILDDAQALLYELVLKNVYIVTTNCAGLMTGGTVSELWSGHRELAEGIAREVIEIQESLVNQPLPADELIEGMAKAFEGDPEHRCMGRSAPARLARALRQADSANLEVPRLREIVGNHRKS